MKEQKGRIAELSKAKHEQGAEYKVQRPVSFYHCIKRYRCLCHCCIILLFGIVCVNGCLISVTGQDSGAGSPCRGGQKKDVTDGATQTGK